MVKLTEQIINQKTTGDQPQDCNDSNELIEQTQRKERRKNRKRVREVWSKIGHWSEEERLRYIIFLDYHTEKFEQKELRRVWKIFKAMSVFIQTRSPDQCRSHHQKMQKKYKSEMDIVKDYKKTKKEGNYQSAYKFYSQNILNYLDDQNMYVNKKLVMEIKQQQMISIPYPDNFGMMTINPNLKLENLPGNDLPSYLRNFYHQMQFESIPNQFNYGDIINQNYTTNVNKIENQMGIQKGEIQPQIVKVQEGCNQSIA